MSEAEGGKRMADGGCQMSDVRGRRQEPLNSHFPLPKQERSPTPMIPYVANKTVGSTGGRLADAVCQNKRKGTG